MVDPADALTLFQKQHEKGEIPFQKGVTDSELFTCSDAPNDMPRFCYARLKDKKIIALVQFVLYQNINKRPCFNIGYAVDKDYRRQGVGKAAVASAMAELEHTLSGYKPFYVEAIISEKNAGSNHLAKKFISKVPEKVIDSVSNLPAYHYLLKVK